MKYDYKAVEAKWQKVWEDEKTFHVEIDHKKPKFYALVEFPYPSGAGLHVGHPRSYTALDVVSRKRRQNGYNVLYPMGWDAFGLPTENFAMKNHIHPAIVTKNNVDHFRSQLKALGFSFDWDREINTTDPEYYKWTQWIFIQLFKKGLAYKKETTVNYCTGCKVVLADQLASLWTALERIGFAYLSAPLAWFGAVGYSLQLYYDFAGYSLMAMGLARMLGFVIPRNFDLPYCSRSISEFWRRWHISLGSWFRDYVYIPLGGNRVPNSSSSATRARPIT